MMSQLDEIIDRVVEGIYRDMPGLLERFGEQGRVKCREDNYHHIKHLNSARNLNSDEFFVDYALWLNNILTVRGMKTEHLIDNFKRLEIEISAAEPFEEKEDYLCTLKKGMAELEELTVESSSYTKR
ncbi:hypothetical protein [Bacillus sp. RAR_GA_16]|uniref:hypothetical protein n=1 Tax=Bacillus sp. RAR_GA_16 TaxID=2876774 RepID=UPI001CC9E927|nr:hypothetical protein [Bacillus sp. RAR_GA_16]MCA0173764.1 hypothetical protein [Bacillus sp. RAR_GA_16]